MQINIVKTAVLSLFSLFLNVFPLSAQNYLAVMDLVSDGSVNKSALVALSDKISQSIPDNSYSQFDRSIMPEILKQFSLDDSSFACYEPQCLIVIGNLIGANTLIGGFISRNNNETSLTLNLIDVASRSTLNSVTISSNSPRSQFLQTEIPGIVNKLLNKSQNLPPPVSAMNNPVSSPSSKAGTERSEKNLKSGKTRNAKPAVFSSIGGAVGLGIVGLVLYFKNSDDGKESPISMDDVPVRVHGK